MHKLHFNQLIFFILLFIFNAFLKLTESQILNQSDERCPEGYFLQTDDLCYPNIRKPCPFESQTSSTSTPAPIPLAKQSLINIRTLECPDGSIMMGNKCRKIICSFGEYYRGTCLQPVCPQGLVWRSKKCQEPAYLTTIIEIDNEIVNEVIEKPIDVTTSHKNEVVYHRSTTTLKPYFNSKSLPLKIISRNPNTSAINTTTNRQIYNDTAACCKVFTPRVCKLYAEKWLCFNRKYERCDKHVCKAPVVYLKAPEIKYQHPVLVMPPNPKLDRDENKNYRNKSEVLDCSGCATLRFENCSFYCYRYICPHDSCIFLELFEYCAKYMGQEGCLPTDGCLWKWCQS